MAEPSSPLVVLLHDQLQDGRIWYGFIDRLSMHVSIAAIPPSPQAEIYVEPPAWVAFMAATARHALADASRSAALVIATGWSAGAALSLLDEGLGRQALLINPGPAPNSDGTLSADLSSLTPEERRLATISPDARAEMPSETQAEQLDSGILLEEGIAYLSEISSSQLASLGNTERRIVQQVQYENLVRFVPLSLGALYSTDYTHSPDWLNALDRNQRRCAVALSGPQAAYAPLQDLLARRMPNLPVVDLRLSTTYPWLEDPNRLDQIATQMLAGTLE